MLKDFRLVLTLTKVQEWLCLLFNQALLKNKKIKSLDSSVLSHFRPRFCIISFSSKQFAFKKLQSFIEPNLIFEKNLNLTKAAFPLTMKYYK